jgi:nucleoside-diphosphate-sugar epimerase
LRANPESWLITGVGGFNVFGCRQGATGADAGVIPQRITAPLDDRVCEIYGDGETTRDLCHVAIVVQADLLAATVPHGDATGQGYNVGPTHDLRAALAEVAPSYVARRIGGARSMLAPVE